MESCFSSFYTNDKHTHKPFSFPAVVHLLTVRQHVMISKVKVKKILHKHVMIKWKMKASSMYCHSLTHSLLRLVDSAAFIQMMASG